MTTINFFVVIRIVGIISTFNKKKKACDLIIGTTTVTKLNIKLKQKEKSNNEFGDYLNIQYEIIYK